jgi:isopentenyl-diphosphate delta-isomerase
MSLPRRSERAEVEPELVVLLDARGDPIGTAPKDRVHAAKTPYHLAFSCYVFGADDRLLLSRRALGKRTFPGVWTNSCCGHPGPGEETSDAVRRRLSYELGLVPTRLDLAVPDFSYRASSGGVEENELCPVFLARVDTEPDPRPEEVAAFAWVTWAEFAARSLQADFSPWARLQVPLLGDAVAGFLRA